MTAPTIHSLPAIRGWRDGAFDPVRPARMNQMQGRRTERRIQGTPHWTAAYESVFLTKEDFGLMDEFRMAMDDGGVFRAYDPFRPRPIAHDSQAPLSGTRAAGGAFDGTATVASIISTTEVAISGLPAHFQLSTGDYIGFVESEYVISLHRIRAPAQANSGGEVTLGIRFALDTQHFTDDAVVHFEKPYCLMQPDPSSWKLGKPVSGDRPVSLSAQEVFFYES